jgi:hypothetical protein
MSIRIYNFFLSSPRSAAGDVEKIVNSEGKGEGRRWCDWEWVAVKLVLLFSPGFVGGDVEKIVNSEGKGEGRRWCDWEWVAVKLVCCLKPDPRGFKPKVAKYCLVLVSFF